MKKYIMFGLIIVLFCVIITAQGDTIGSIIIPKEQKETLASIGLTHYSIKDIPTEDGRGFYECLKGISISYDKHNRTIYTENDAILNYCSEQVFHSREDADTWQKEKMILIANLEIERKSLATPYDSIVEIRE